MTVARYTAMPGLAEVQPPLTLDAAHAHACKGALAESAIGSVGIEAEAHLVDLREPARRVTWPRVECVAPELTHRARHSAVTFEPGGQVELSGVALPGVVAAVAAVRDDLQRVRVALAAHDLGLAHVGADPLRAPQRVNPRARYREMAHHFAACGLGAPGATMMTGTAALQLNLQAGPRSGWAARVRLAHWLAPTLLALSACSRWLGGSDSGWASARERSWKALNAGFPSFDDDSSEPSARWADYALGAPVLFVSSAEGASAVTRHVTFAEWARGDVRLGGRHPTAVDLDVHLTTLFPPVRLRGFLELRYLDMTPSRWWPGIAAVAVTLLDDAQAADEATEATEDTHDLRTEAARVGLDHPALGRSARRCLEIAAARAPAGLEHAIDDLAELVFSGRSPGELWHRRIEAVGPSRALLEAAHA